MYLRHSCSDAEADSEAAAATVELPQPAAASHATSNEERAEGEPQKELTEAQKARMELKLGKKEPAIDLFNAVRHA
jgi:hypothetical protein